MIVNIFAIKLNVQKNKLVLWEGVWTSEIKRKLEQKQGIKGAAEFLPRGLMLQLAWFPNVANLSFKDKSISVSVREELR